MLLETITVTQVKASISDLIDTARGTTLPDAHNKCRSVELRCSPDGDSIVYAGEGDTSTLVAVLDPVNGVYSATLPGYNLEDIELVSESGKTAIVGIIVNQDRI
jgi:hypothetical protein